jgi:catechol 2,3-dioxygenase-like lactoylglutathione lyase family enzyme
LLSPVGSGPLAGRLDAHLEREGEGPYAIAFGTDDAAACAAMLRERGLNASAPLDGAGRDAVSGAERRWQTVPLSRTQTGGVPLFVIEHRSPADTLPMAGTTDHAAAVHGVDHAVIMTTDADAACRLYRDQLGLRLAFDRSFAERGVRLLFFRVGGVTLELAAPLTATPDANARDRFWGISWRVADVDAARARLLGAGFEVSEVRAGQKPGTRVCTVRRETRGVATLLIEPQRSAA